MSRILDIGHTDLRLFFRHRTSIIWLFLMPLAFIYFTGFANRGPDAPGNRRPPLFVENADTNFAGRIFCEELGAQGLRLLKPDEAADTASEIHVPADFTSRLLRGEQTKMRFIKRGEADEGDAAIIELRLARALIALNGHLLEAGAQTNSTAALTEDQLRALIQAPNPVGLEARYAGRKPVPAGFSFSLPATLVMYLTMNLLIFGGVTMAAERQHGIIRRLVTSPTSRTELVQGKIYGLMLLGVVQIAFFLALGKFAFHVNLGANLPGVALVLLVLSWVAGSLGVLLGSITVAEDRVIGVSVLSALIMAAMGGCWWPLEIAPPAQKVTALCFPTGWALKALHQLISFGSGFADVLVPLAVLLAFGTAANLLAARFFRS
jgi:ABC-type multidrug transport system permease subunit